MNEQYRSDVMDISPSQKKASGVVVVMLLVGLLAWLIFVLCKAVQVSFGSVIVGSLLGFVGLSLLFTGLIERNTVSLWLSFPFLVPSVLALLCTGYGVLSYADWYPLYIAIPAIASFFTMMLSRQFKSHLKVILVFGLEAGCYLFAVLGVLPLWVSILLGCVWAVAVVVYIFIFLLRSSKHQ